MSIFRRPAPDPRQDDAIRAEKQRYLRAVRAGGYGKTARREQLRLDAINRKRRGREE